MYSRNNITRINNLFSTLSPSANDKAEALKQQENIKKAHKNRIKMVLQDTELDQEIANLNAQKAALEQNASSDQNNPAQQDKLAKLELFIQEVNKLKQLLKEEFKLQDKYYGSGGDRDNRFRKVFKAKAVVICFFAIFKISINEIKVLLLLIHVIKI